MPELPEVESARYLAEKHCLSSVIEKIVTLEMGGGPREGQFDDKVYETEADQYERLEGKKLVSLGRQGKQMYFILTGDAGDTSTSLLFHFGMTGSFVIRGEQIPSYKSFVVDTSEMEWPPKFTKCMIRFENGRELAFCDPRRLGKIRIRGPKPEMELPISKLALDPLQWEGGVVPDAFRQKLKSLSTNIKSVLLDQEKVVSGVGNWVADEVLYQTGIHPSVSCSALPNETVTLLGQTLVNICRVACECTCSFKSFPEEWLFHTRWGKGKAVSKDYLGNVITFETVGGRTSAIVTAVQKKTFKNGGSAEVATSSRYFAEGERTMVKSKAKVEVKEEAETGAEAEPAERAKKGKSKGTKRGAPGAGAKKSKAVKKE